MEPNFKKMYYKNYCNFLDNTKSKYDKVRAFLLRKMNNNNVVCCTYRMIANNTPCTEDNVGDIMRDHMTANFLKKISPGQYMINPAIIMKGSGDRFSDLCDIYNSL